MLEITQKELIHNSDWDILLVLDALRYDIFEKFYPSFLTGRLQKTESPTAFTFGWILEMFKGQHPNIVFVYSEPMSDRIKDISNKLIHGNHFDVRAHFTDIVDVYKSSWNFHYNTIFPTPITEATIKAVHAYPGKRVITKYIQLHDPYLYTAQNDGVIRYRSPRFLNLRKILYELISDETYWTIRSKLNFPPENWFNVVWLKYGRKGIIEGYINDLFLMLTIHIPRIIQECPNKKIVITSDHGERLGEGGRYSHGGRRTKEVKEIPWFEIEGFIPTEAEEWMRNKLF